MAEAKADNITKPSLDEQTAFRVAEASRGKRRITTKKQRQLLENAIDRLVELLDEIDGDADSEPSLGWLNTDPLYPQDARNGYGTGDDREDQCEDEGAEDGVWA